MKVIPEGTRNSIKEFLQNGSEVDGQLQSISHNVGPSVTHRNKQKRTPVIGIFSRESEGSYRWLTDHLTTEFHIKTFYISNRGEWKQREDFYECTYAILYHSKNRGRVNITDVTDSLYNEELQFLSAVLGKKKVIVVADDLEDAGPEAKRTILRNQPSIKNLAAELFLFSVKEKQSLLNDGPITKKLVAMKLIFYGIFKFSTA
eukprot:XP_017952734.1 PREDICTED: uncharacterized protein LOC108648804 [Xenopus tropicalis]